jgi:hypothetical protein
LIGTCRLCQKYAELRESHILPAFALRWLKENSLTKYIRSGGQPNLRKQDLAKEYLLCDMCEGLFSQWESKVAENIFKPWNDQRKLPLSYGSWLQRFAISLSWRAGVSGRDDFLEKSSEFIVAYDKALEHWRQFLLGEQPAVNPYEHHLFFATEVKEIHGAELPGKFHSYCLRAFDYSYLVYNHRIYICCVIPGLVFFSSVQPPKLKGCKGTLIGKKGTFEDGQVFGEAPIGSWILKRAQECSDMPLSEKQRKRIEQDTIAAMKAEPDNSKLKKKTEAIMADLLWKHRQKF